MKLLRLVTRVNNTVKFNRGIKEYHKESQGELTKPVACSIYVLSNRSITLQLFFFFYLCEKFINVMMFVLTSIWYQG